MKTIKVSLETWKKLQEIKIEKGYRSLEQVIRELLDNYESKKQDAVHQLLKGFIEKK